MLKLFRPARRHRLAGLLATTSVVAVGLALAMATPSHADWTGATSTDWFTGTNWSGGAVPTIFDYVMIGTDTPNATVVGAPGAVAGNLFVGYLGTGTLTIQNGGAVSNGVGYIGYNPGSTGTVTVSGAGSSWTNSGALSVGILGTGTLTVANGGTVSVSGRMTIASQAGSTGTLNVGAASGQAAVAPGTVNASSVAFGSGTGGIVFNHTASNYIFAPTISGEGSVTVEAGTTILTGANTYSGGTTVSGGTLQGTTTSLQGNITDNAAVVFNQSTNGTYAGVMSGTGSLTKLGTGTLTLTGANTYSGGTTVNAGTLAVSSDANLGAATGGLTFGGGTLQWGATFGSGRSVTLNAGGGTFDTQANTGTLSGDISGSGGLTKLGAGTLVLSGACGSKCPDFCPTMCLARSSMSLVILTSWRSSKYSDASRTSWG
jgi:T5SS/PEP-CTERM-associated repeat protein/autotransporter-associated beta strand protein